ncbi:MAG: hypothetical protein IZT56_15245 [Bacteroidetes bacterium]|nr:hypothetical protein [Bacteroidota bacterium]
MKKLLALTSLFLLLFMVSCSSDSDDDDIIVDPPASITYTNTIKSIMSGNCTSCHGNPTTNNAPMSLTTYANVKNAVENRGLISQVESGNMPKNASMLSSTQIANIKTWKANGYLE